MDDSVLHTLALEYLKANRNFKTLSVKDFYQQYSAIYDELHKLDSAEKQRIANESMKSFLKI